MNKRAAYPSGIDDHSSALAITIFVVSVHLAGECEGLACL